MILFSVKKGIIKHHFHLLPHLFIYLIYFPHSPHPESMISNPFKRADYTIFIIEEEINLHPLSILILLKNINEKKRRKFV